MRPEQIAFADGMPVKVFVRQVEQYPYHWHDTLEIMQVLNGEVNISLGDHTFDAGNDVAVTNIGEIHRITDGGIDNMLLIIHIDGDFCRSVLPSTSTSSSTAAQPITKPKCPEVQVLKEYIARLVQGLGERARRA